MEGFEFDVFISYSSQDRAWVRDPLIRRLRAAGLKICIDWEFEIGASAVISMENAILRSRKTLLVMTSTYFESQWARFENLMLQASDPTNEQRRLIPLRKQICEIPPRIKNLTYVDFTDPEEIDLAWRQLLTALGRPPEDDLAEVETPDRWCLVHPYPAQANFTGRIQEQERLSGWLMADPGHPLLVLRALGGFGKSALCWHWLIQRVDSEWRVVWWSFYEQGATFDQFMRETLGYLGIPEDRLPNSSQQIGILIGMLYQTGILLVMDGFERQLRAYQSMSAVYQGDQVQTQDRGLECINPLAEEFLRNLACLPGIQSKVLITTRLRPAVLEGHGELLLQGCREIELDQMDRADAVALFRAYGIRGTRGEIEGACDRYGFHPLSLRLVLGLVLEDLQLPGDIAAADRLDVGGDVKQKQHHVLEQAYSRLDPDQGTVLSRLACFRSPVKFEVLQKIGGSDPRQVERSLRKLVRRGLVQREKDSFDLHPIVRRYAYERIGSGDRQETHSELRDYFAAVETPDRVQRVEDLMPVIELYHHTVQAGELDRALELYEDRLGDVLYFQLGAYQVVIELMRSLFVDGEDQPPRLQSSRAQSWAMNELARSYVRSGRSPQAVEILQRKIDINEADGDQKSLAVGLESLAHDQRQIGSLQAAEGNCRRMIAITQEIQDEFLEGIGHAELGLTLIFLGRWAEADQELDRALELFEKDQHIQPQGLSWAYRSWGSLLQYRSSSGSKEDLAAKALQAATRALDLANETARIQHPYERDYIQSHWLLGSAHLINDNVTEAEHYLTDALTRCRRINLVEDEADILLSLARLRSTTGDRSDALRLAQTALTITDRCEHAPQGADIHLFLAQQALATGDRSTALAHARQAQDLATCDGSPDYTYTVAYDQALELIGYCSKDPDPDL